MRHVSRFVRRLQGRRKAAMKMKPATTSVVADHVSRTLLRQGYADLGQVEHGLNGRLVAFAPHSAAPAPKTSLLDRVADGVAEATHSWWFVAGFALVVVAWVLATLFPCTRSAGPSIPSLRHAQVRADHGRVGPGPHHLSIG
jgi:hypothetical protein